MISFRLSVIALSATLIFSVGSSASTATTNYSHIEFSVAESRTLNLRETGSQIVMETIEDALRAGGLALLGEGFQIDSSLSWVFGETIEGEVDVAVPLWSRGGHIVFAQPGAVFWTGFEEEERMDGNFGVVYRTMMAEDVIGGVSLFYDHDFQIGHSRLGVGIDAQKEGFHGAFNYYHPLSDTEDGREGYVEDALQGMDIRLAVESDVTRFGGNVGYWKFKGDEDKDVREDWKLSYGIDAGLRIIPGVFLEGSLQRHDKDVSLGQRASVGLAFKFSLPDFKGKSYGDGSMSANLYKIVDREKRILYEERVAGPTVSIVRTGNETIAADTEVTIPVDVRLSEELAEDVTINLVGSGSATYNDDYTVSVSGTDCTGITEDDCQVTITAGELTPGGDVVITIINDGRTNEPAEDIILSMVIASAGDMDLVARGPLTLTIPADLPLPTVSLSADPTSITEGNTATITLTLNEMLEEDAIFNLIIGGDATYGASNDWNLSVGGTDCDMASESAPCQVTISQGDTTAEVTVEVNTDATAESLENFTVSVVVDSGSTTLVTLGSSSRLTFTIPANNTIKFASSMLTVTEDIGASFVANFLGVHVDLSSNLPAGIEITLVEGGDTEDDGYGISINNNQHNNNNARYDSATGVWTLPTGTTRGSLVFEALNDTDTDNEMITLTLTDPNNNLPPGWSIVEPSVLTIEIMDDD